MFTSDMLTRDERIQIYQWAGEGYTAREICKMFNKSRPPDSPTIRVPGVEKILSLPEAHKFVSQFRVAFLKDLKSIPISEKKIRLDDLERIRQRLMYIVSSTPVQKLVQGDTSKFLSVTRRVIEVLDLARTEMEPRSGLPMIFGSNSAGGDLSELSDEDLQKRRVELLRQAELLIKQGSSSVDEVGEGSSGPGEEGSAEILLAPSEELRRDEMQDS